MKIKPETKYIYNNKLKYVKTKQIYKKKKKNLKFTWTEKLINLTWPMMEQDENLENIEFEPRMNQRQPDEMGDNRKNK